MKPYVLIAASFAALAPIQAQAQSKTIVFPLTVSAGASTCLPKAAKAGCPNTSTPFNGEHNAGIQVLNTAHFPDTPGPLFNLK